MPVYHSILVTVAAPYRWVLLTESIQLETMYMSKGQIWVWFDSPDGTKFFDLLYLNGPGSVKASTSHLHCDRGVRIPPVSTKSSLK